MHKRLHDAPALNPVFRSHLRLVEERDAALIAGLRSDPNLNAHLSPSSPDVEAQRAWIARYKVREHRGEELYFVIVCDGEDRGVVRMYDFRQDPRSFCWGSWIIRPPRPPGLVTFSAVMVYEIGFHMLDFEQSHFDVRRDNQKVIDFHLRAGAEQTGGSGDDLFFRFSLEAWLAFNAAASGQIKSHRSV